MKGHPVLGVISGFLFGLFVALDLIFFRVVASDTILIVLLPLLGLLGGVALAAWAPIGGRSLPVATPGPGQPPPPEETSGVR